MHLPPSALRAAEGRVTRGKTARNRLRRIDAFLARYDPELLRRRDGEHAGALFVDLGYGAEPHTTLESAARLRRLNPGLPVLGVEIDPERVERARPFADEATAFRFGGFNLPLRSRADGARQSVRLIRAFNVLRQYEEEAVEPAYDTLAAALLPGGLLIEGTSDPLGRIWTANLVRRPAEPGADRPWRLEALAFGTSFRDGFDPAAFRAILPKSLIHRMRPGEPIHAFMADWERAARETRPVRVWGWRQWFAAAAEGLARRGHRLELRRSWLRRGWLVWRDPQTPARSVY